MFKLYPVAQSCEKNELHPLIRVAMKRNLPVNLFILPFLLALGHYSAAQCASGWNEATLNWDQMDYLTTAGNYAGFVTPSMRDTQFFTIGVNRVKFKLTGITTAGENGANTAEAGSYGSGDDVEYGNTGTVEITFDAPVFNLRFSIYDIDANQRMVLTATDAGGNALPVNMAALSTGVLTITGSGSNIATAQASGTSVGNADLRGTVNINIPGGTAGVKTVIINSNNAAGNFWLSDLTACVQGTFPKNYYASQKPFNGQPAYYLVTPDNNSVYLFNPATGVSDWLFSEPESQWINSVAYDHVNHIVYYVRDNPSPVSTNKMLKKYDVTTGTIGVVVNDITTLGIPVYDIVVESAGAAFYNGSLYLGVEGSNTRKNSNRESIVWRIDFDENLNAVAASQVFARPADNGSGTLMHDWGDFAIKDGILYDFNTGNVGSTSQFIHHDMQTGQAVIYSTNGNPAPIQVGQTWDGKLYWTGGQGNESGRVAIYNENGTIGTKINATTVTRCSPPWEGRAGDASDPYKPQSDFGDAPASYDPPGVDPATHEYDCNLRLGPTYDREWDKYTSSDATGDGNDEDAIDFATLLTPGFTTYVQEVKVYNNTGSTARLVAWLDYNGDGVFSPEEGISRNVSSSSSMQTISLSWNNINVTILATNRTYMRLRLTSASNNLTVNDPNGWFANGEVEDHIVPVDIILPVQLINFTAKNENDHRVLLDWTTENEVNMQGYHIERSADGINWENIGFVPGKSSNAVNTYNWYDYNPLTGKSHYRLKMTDADGRSKYSWMVSVEMTEKTNNFRVLPNPVRNHATVEFTANANDAVTVQLINMQGRVLLSRSLTAHAGTNKVTFGIPGEYTNGVYFIKLITPKGSRQTKVLVSK